MFHLACVQTSAWINFDQICYTILGYLGSEFIIMFEIFYKLNNFTLNLMFYLAFVQTLHGWILIISAILYWNESSL